MVAGLSEEANVSSLIKERAVMYYLVVMGAVAAFYSATPLPPYCCFHILPFYQIVFSNLYCL